MLVFNGYAIVPVVFGVMLAWLIGSGGNVIVGIIVGSLVAGGLDLLIRWRNWEEHPAPLVHQYAGGHLFFIPVWMLPIFGLLVFGMNSFGFFDVKAKPKKTPVAQQPAPPVQPAAVAQVPAAPTKPKRITIEDAPVTSISLKGRSVTVEGTFTDKDAVDPKFGDLPVKIYEIPLKADTAYWLSFDPPTLMTTLTASVQDRQGQLVPQGPSGPHSGPNRIFLISPATAAYRVVVNARTRDFGKFSFAITEMAPGDSLRDQERLSTKDRAPISLNIAKRTENFLHATIAPDCSSAWIAFPKGKLQRVSLPGFAQTFEAQFSKLTYRLAVNGRGVLCAAVQRDNPKTQALPWYGLGPADLHLYGPTSLASANEVLTPTHVVPVNGLIEELVVSADDECVYYMDASNHTVGKVNLTTGKLDRENQQLDASTKSMCVPSDGHAIYTCGTANVVQRLDAVTLEIQETIRLDRGSPNGIQVTARGDIFLKDSNGPIYQIYLLNGRHDYQGEVAKVQGWASVFQQAAILLSPDEKQLFASCFFVSPANITGYHVPSLPALYRGEQSGAISLDTGNSRGTLAISRNGKYLFSDAGVFLEITPPVR